MAEAYCKINDELHIVIKHMMKKLKLPRSTFIRHLIHIGLRKYVETGYLTFSYDTMEFDIKREEE